MQIPSDYNAGALHSAYQSGTEQIRAPKSRDTATVQSTPEQGADRVSVSQDARMLAQMQHVAQQSPDTRADKVAALKAQVENGTYTMDNKAIATAMLRDDMRIFS